MIITIALAAQDHQIAVSVLVVLRGFLWVFHFARRCLKAVRSALGQSHPPLPWQRPWPCGRSLTFHLPRVRGSVERGREALNRLARRRDFAARLPAAMVRRYSVGRSSSSLFGSALGQRRLRLCCSHVPSSSNLNSSRHEVLNELSQALRATKLSRSKQAIAFIQFCSA